MSLQGHTFSSLEGHSNREWSLITAERFLPSKKKRQEGESGEGPTGQTQSSAWENYEASPEGLCPRHEGQGSD